ncbi:serpin family protein [Bacteroidota bacterium]
MKKIINIYLLLIIVMGLIQCSNSPAPEEKIPPRELTIAEKEIVSSDNNFGLKLFREVISEESDKNVFISPLSVSMALGMTYNGSAGSTREAMQETLELAGLTEREINESYRSLIGLLRNLDEEVVFQIANSIWYRLGWTFEEEFLNINKYYFDALVSGLDFGDPQSHVIINNWVDENTNGKIKDIVEPPINPETVMFLINAIYFKGTWTYEFDKDLTKDDIFNMPDGSQAACKMMEQDCKFQYFENEDFQAVDMPYGDGLYSMTVFLPRPQKDINDFIEEFNNENWNEWLNCFQENKGLLHFPKFKLEYKIELKKALTALGMGIAFDGADFTNMYKPGGLFISSVKHKTFIDVYEEGTEAAAVTSVEIGYGSTHDFIMNVNRPFVFAIRENHSGTILFIGKVIEPLTE